MLASRPGCHVVAEWNTIDEVVKTVLKARPTDAVWVQELSGNRPGAIAECVALLQPEVGIVTAIGTDHRKNFRSLEATAAEKGALIECLPPHGVAILNADDPLVRAMAMRTKARVVTYGRSADADVRADDVRSAWPERLSFTLTIGHDRLAVPTTLVGEHWVTPVLAAITGGVALGIDLGTCIAAVRDFEPVYGRNSVCVVPHGATFILDTEKASSWTVPAALQVVAAANAVRKTIIIGTISDYPGTAGSRYRGTAKEALKVADRVIFVGGQAARVAQVRAEVAPERLLAFATVAEAHAYLAQNMRPHELIYVKGSSTDHLERLFIANVEPVSCWIERCGRVGGCPACRYFKTVRGMAPRGPLLSGASGERLPQ